MVRLHRASAYYRDADWMKTLQGHCKTCSSLAASAGSLVRCSLARLMCTGGYF
jgi:hypothetical protein